MTRDIFTSVDLEFNQPSQKIIQIGYCIYNIRTEEILLSKSIYVNPREEISEYINNLTGITQNDVENGVDLGVAYKELKEDHLKYGSFINCVTWGGGDAKMLEQQLDIKEGEGAFGRRWIDIKTIWINIRLAKGENIQGGLANTLKKNKIKPQGQHHNAQFDALHTALLHCKLLKDLSKINYDN